MPRLSALFIRCALLYLAIGFTLGALLLSNKGVPYAPEIWNWLPVHMELVLVGWLLQLAMGMAFWILPRFGQNQPRGDERPAWAAFTLINLGIWLAAAGSLLNLPAFFLAGRSSEALAGLLFGLASWKRVKPVMSQNL